MSTTGTRMLPGQPSRFELLVSQEPIAPAAHFTLEPYNPEQERDYVRMFVTIALLALFGFIVVWVAVKSSAPHDVWKQTEDMLTIVLPALTGLIGSVLGFYFGSQKNRPPSPPA
jgi:uncharacterized membrane protein YsdA (DUF1294 family)